MKKHGFTLAEVLITLGIVGVVAALTAPALVLSSRNEANAAKLSVTVSNLENAFSSILVKENVDSLFNTNLAAQSSNRAGFAGNIAGYMHINGFRTGTDNIARVYYGSVVPHGMSANGTDNGKSVRSSLASGGDRAHVIELKNGATVFINVNTSRPLSDANKQAIMNAGGGLFNQFADVFIDVNGVNSPNIVGRDIFGFYLGDNGILYPMGGTDVSVIDSCKDGLDSKDKTCNANITNVWNNEKAGWSCVDGHIGDSGWGCTARVIAEGYKINY